jgi:hypothetical protein
MAIECYGTFDDEWQLPNWGAGSAHQNGGSLLWVPDGLWSITAKMVLDNNEPTRLRVDAELGVGALRAEDRIDRVIVTMGPAGSDSDRLVVSLMGLAAFEGEATKRVNPIGMGLRFKEPAPDSIKKIHMGYRRIIAHRVGSYLFQPDNIKD